IVKDGGGILTEFFSGTKPDKHNFPLRNRIVAGLSDATVVVETNIKGGSMITAKLADAYNRDVFAVPGRTSDKVSSGCNHLIKYNKAILLTDAEELMDVLGWKEKKKERVKQQKELFIELSAEEKQIVQLLQEKEMVHIDEINLQSGLSSSAAAAAILNLELQNVIASLPGKMYKLI
ncbi:MAG TPA: DNA-processing protein DprA, partial [Flavisolibacter sp.]|nr:DNA-processing protein DprA [Flavisolibacter sp.]